MNVCFAHVSEQSVFSSRRFFSPEHILGIFSYDSVTLETGKAVQRFHFGDMIRTS